MKRAARNVGYSYLIAILLTLFFIVTLYPVSIFIPCVYDLVPSLMISEGTILVPALIFLLCTPMRINDMLGFHKISLKTALLALLLVLALYPGIVTLSMLSQFFVENVVSTTIGSSLGNLPMWGGILVIGVIGPLIEELIFRGYYYHMFRISGRIAGSVILTAILFGLMHMNLNQAGYAMFLGIFLALAVEATGSTTTSFLCHMFFNSAETILMYVSADFVGEETEAESMQELFAEMGIGYGLVEATVFAILFMITAIGILLALLILNKMAKIEGRRPLFFEKKKSYAFETKRKGLLSLPLVIGIILSGLYIVIVDLIL